MLQEKKKIEIDLRRFVEFLLAEGRVDEKKIISYLLSEGKKISEVAQAIGSEFWPVYRFVRSEGLADAMTPRHGRRLSKKTIEEIRRLLFVEGKNPSEIQTILKLKSRSPIYCLLEAHKRAEEKKAGDFQPRQTTQPRRCQRHGLVNVWPCVACEAEAARGVVPKAEDDESEGSENGVWLFP